MNEHFTNEQTLVQHLKETYEDADTTNFGVLDFASAFGSPLDALVYSKLFWPDFVEFEGMVFHAFIMESDEDQSRVRLALSKGQSKAEIERSFNQFEIPSSFFASNRGLTTSSETKLLAERLVEMWRARLRELFPSRLFCVDASFSYDEEPTILVWQDGS